MKILMYPIFSVTNIQFSYLFVVMLTSTVSVNKIFKLKSLCYFTSDFTFITMINLLD